MNHSLCKKVFVIFPIKRFVVDKNWLWLKLPHMKGSRFPTKNYQSQSLLCLVNLWWTSSNQLFSTVLPRKAHTNKQWEKLASVSEIHDRFWIKLWKLPRIQCSCYLHDPSWSRFLGSLAKTVLLWTSITAEYGNQKLHLQQTHICRWKWFDF